MPARIFYHLTYLSIPAPAFSNVRKAHVKC